MFYLQFSESQRLHISKYIKNTRNDLNENIYIVVENYATNFLLDVEI